MCVLETVRWSVCSDVHVSDIKIRSDVLTQRECYTNCLWRISTPAICIWFNCWRCNNTDTVLLKTLMQLLCSLCWNSMKNRILTKYVNLLQFW